MSAAAPAAQETVLIIDFGSQVTQLIARRVREEGVYSEVVPFQKAGEAIARLKPRAIILSGGPASVIEGESPKAPDVVFEAGVPVLLSIESFVRRNGGERMRAFPVRQALLQIVCSVLVRTAAPALASALWGPKDESRALVLATFAGATS